MVSAILDAAASAEPVCDYLATETHYLSIAGRICGALRDGSLVLVAGDPPIDPLSLSDALRAAAQSHRAVIGVPGGPGLTADALVPAGSLVGVPAAVGGTAMTAKTPEGTPPLFVFDEADRLSERQLEEICEAVQSGAGKGAAGVLLARPGFLARLEEPALRFLKAALAGQFRFDEIGEDERIDFLRHQIASRQTRDPARRISSGLFRSLAAFAMLSTIGIGALLAVHYFPIAGTTVPGSRSPPADRTPPASPIVTATETAQPMPPAAALASAQHPTPPQPAAAVGKTTQLPPMQMPQPMGPSPSVAQSPSGQGLSPAEVAALLTRGDGFLAAGDIASARLFYERAADAGDGAAALRLAATFDPAFLGGAGIRGASGDPAQAAAWYRRARDLGSAAAERPKILDGQPGAGSDPSAR